VQKPVIDALTDLLRKRLKYLHRDGEAFFNAEQNARIVAAAEQYYRVMYYGDAVSWNLRDQHMFETLERLLAHRGPDSKAVVWAHNSHVGNAEFTEMGQVRGEHNIGQLSRSRFGEDAALIGFGTDPRHRCCCVGLGRTDGDQARAPSAPALTKPILSAFRLRPPYSVHIIAVL
jgi:erythromycin esterase-like protein